MHGVKTVDGKVSLRMKYKLVCECGYQTALTEDEDELEFDIKHDLLNHQEWCEIAIKNGGEHEEEE